MPKKALNINDFSGGIVSNKNPRDLEDNQCQNSSGFVSINPGELTLSSGFVHPVGFQNNEGGYQQEVLTVDTYVQMSFLSFGLLKSMLSGFGIR